LLRDLVSGGVRGVMSGDRGEEIVSLERVQLRVHGRGDSGGPGDVAKQRDLAEVAALTRVGDQVARVDLDLAIADWVSKERNVELGFVILDEVIGSQDDERRQRLLTELRSLSTRFRQMLVITHLSDIAELCDSQLDVSLVEPGLSQATIT
jgi:hypothetical protein